jgi:hypothetical protein
MNERANKSLRQTATHYFSLFISKLCAVKIFMCVCVCVCVSERERERERERETNRNA